MTKTIEFARENGFVETLLGRRRYLRDINSRNTAIRNAAERNAINMPMDVPIVVDLGTGSNWLDAH